MSNSSGVVKIKAVSTYSTTEYTDHSCHGTTSNTPCAVVCASSGVGTTFSHQFQTLQMLTIHI